MKPAAIFVVAALVAVATAGNCPGVCQPNTLSCPGSYLSGLCPGSSSIECCPQATPSCNGQCQVTSLSCSAGAYQPGLCPGPSNIECCPQSAPSNPVVNLKAPGAAAAYHTGPFGLSSGAGAPSELTNASIWYDSSMLWVSYTVQDSQIYSPYSQCDDSLYNADVVECFVGPASTVSATGLSKYIEIEVSPFDVLFVSNVTNSNGQCSGIVGDLLDCASTGIYHDTKLCNTTSECSGLVGYRVQLGIPWSLLMTFFPGQPAVPLNWRVNLFRIDHWVSPALPTQYQAWSPDFASPACFHMPAYFGYVNLPSSPIPKLS